jgi:hypothetical protein
MKSPFNPNVKDDDDVTRFDKFEEESPFYPEDVDDYQRESDSASKMKGKKRKDMNFPGYTYKKDVEE